MEIDIGANLLIVLFPISFFGGIALIIWAIGKLEKQLRENKR